MNTKTLRRAFALLLCLLAFSCLLLGCSSAERDIPSGMQRVEGASEMGLNFFISSAWQTQYVEGIPTAYYSDVDTSSVTAVVIPSDEDSEEAYFAAERAEYELYFTEFTVDTLENADGTATEAEAFSFGKDKTLAGVRFTCHGKRGDVKYTIMQVIDKTADGFLIITYIAPSENNSNLRYSPYAYHLEDVNAALAQFSFTK